MMPEKKQNREARVLSQVLRGKIASGSFLGLASSLSKRMTHYAVAGT